MYKRPSRNPVDAVADRRTARQNVAAVKVDGRSPEPIDPAHRAAVMRGLAQAERGEFASPGDVEALFQTSE